MNLNCLLLLIVFISLGQFSNAQKESSSSVGLFYSPTYAYRTLSADGGTASSIVDLRNSIEEPTLTATIGITYIYQFGFGLTLESGVQYAQKGEQQKTSDLTFAGGGTATFRNWSYYEYVEIPVKADTTSLQVKNCVSLER